MFDLVFLATCGIDIAAEVPSPVPLALAVAKKSKRSDLVILCSKAQSGSITLAIPSSSKDLRDFQDLCREFEFARDRSLLPLDEARALLDRCEEGFSGLGAELSSAIVSVHAARLDSSSRLSRFPAAEARYEAVLGIFDRYQMNLALASIYEELAMTYQARDSLDLAGAALLEAADLFKAEGKPGRASDCRIQAAECLTRAGENRLAAMHVIEALNLARRSYSLGGKPEALLASLDRAASLLERVGDSERLLAIRKEAAGISSRTTDPALRVEALRSYASAVDAAGKTVEAGRVRSEADSALRSLIAKLRTSIKTLSGSKTPDNARLGESHSRLGWALEQQKSMRDAASAYAGAARHYEAASRYRDALSCLSFQRRCLGDDPPTDLIADKAEQWSQWDSACGELMSLATRHDSDPPAARKYYERGISAARKCGPYWLLTMLSTYGRFLQRNGDRPQAEKHLLEAVEVARETWCRSDDFTALYLSAVEASDSREKALALLEDWAQHALSASQHELAVPSQPGKNVVEAISKLLSTEIEAGRKAQASDFASRFSASPSLKPAYLASIGQSDELRAKIGAVVERNTAAKVASGRASVVKWLTETLAAVYGHAPDPRRIMRQVDALPKDTAFVQYLVTRSGVYTLTSSDMSITCLGSGSALEEAMNEFRQVVLLAQADVSSGLMLKPPTTEPDSMTKALTHLHSLLVRPILPSLKGKARLLVALPGEMTYVPLHALVSAETGRYLIEDFPVCYACSGEVSKTAGTAPWSEVTVLVADRSVAPAVEDEVVGIKSAFPSSRCLRGVEISESFEQVIMQARCIHIAAHCSAGRGSTVEFGGSKAPCSISIDDVYGIKAPDLDLVVLSCCESAGGVETHVGIDASLVSAFEFVGARSIVASLWRVSDRASAVFAQHFYAALATGRSKAEALQSAQLAVASAPGLRHPFYWAAFALFGDPS